jgi:hypothetical protein
VPEACKERTGLSQAVVDAVAKVYGAKKDYDSAKQKRAVDATPAAALQRARDAERLAVRALEDHIKQHGCKA